MTKLSGKYAARIAGGVLALALCVLVVPGVSLAKESFQGPSPAETRVRISLGGMSVSDEARGENLFSFDAVEVGGVDVDSLRKKNLPASLSLLIRGLRLNPGSRVHYVDSDQYRKALKRFSDFDGTVRELGYGAGVAGMKADIGIDYVFDGESGRFALKSASFGIQDAGEIEVGCILGGVSDTLMKKLSEIDGVGSLLAALSLVTVEEVAFRYTDDSLLERVVALRKRTTGLDIDKSRAAAAEKILEKISRTNNASTREIGTQMADFLTGRSREINIVIRPEKAIPLPFFPGYVKSILQ